MTRLGQYIFPYNKTKSLADLGSTVNLMRVQPLVCVCRVMVLIWRWCKLTNFAVVLLLFTRTTCLLVLPTLPLLFLS